MENEKDTELSVEVPDKQESETELDNLEKELPSKAEKQKLKTLQENLGLEAEEAQQALELADGDLKQAKEMVGFVDKNYLLLQGKLKYGGYNRTYGLFYLVVAGKSGSFLQGEIVFSDKSILEEVEVEVNNEAFVKTIAKYNHQRDNKINLSELLLPAEISKLFSLVKEGEQQTARMKFGEKLEQQLEETVDLKLNFELKTKVELEKMHPRLFAEGEEEREDDEQKEEQNKGLNLDFTLKCLPVVSPANGKRPTELNIGDRLLVKIVDDSDIGRYFQSLVSNNSGLTTGIIEKISPRANLNNYLVTIKFGPRIYGELIVGSEIKIVVNPNKEILKKEELAEDSSFVFSNYLLAIIILTILSLLFILIYLVI